MQAEKEGGWPPRKQLRRQAQIYWEPEFTATELRKGLLVARKQELDSGGAYNLVKFSSTTMAA